MAVISFASLKGGVGKTSLSINVAQAFAQRGCRTLLLDLDPSAHATRFFLRRTAAVRPQLNQQSDPSSVETDGSAKRAFAERLQEGALHDNPRESGSEFSSSGLVDGSFVKLLLSPEERTMGGEHLAEALQSEGMVRSAGDDLDYLPGGNELRHVLVGRGAKAFAKRFPPIVQELRFHYDHIVVDTSPDFNLITRNALALSDLVAIPVDPSEMSIHSLEELLHSAQHLRRPTWAVLRTMVNKKAQRTKVLSEERLQQRLTMQSVSEGQAFGEAGAENSAEYDIEDPYDFMRMLQEWERDNGAEFEGSLQPSPRPRNPLYLLRSLVYRTEQQNQLSFTGKTAFDARGTSALASQYLAVARELESLVSSEGDGTFEDQLESATDRTSPASPSEELALSHA